MIMLGYEQTADPNTLRVYPGAAQPDIEDSFAFMAESSAQCLAATLLSIDGVKTVDVCKDFLTIVRGNGSLPWVLFWPQIARAIEIFTDQDFILN